MRQVADILGNKSEELVTDVLTDIRAELEGTSDKDADSMDFIKSPGPAP